MLVSSNHPPYYTLKKRTTDDIIDAVFRTRDSGIIINTTLPVPPLAPPIAVHHSRPRASPFLDYEKRQHPEIAKLTSTNCHACFAFSTLVFTHSWAAQDKSRPSALFFVPKSPGIIEGENVQWVKLHRGTHDIIQHLFQELCSGPMGPLFSPWVGLDPDRPDPITEGEERELCLLPSAWHNYECNLGHADREVLDRNLEKLRRVFSMMQFNPEVSKLSIVMSWLSWITDDYLKMLEEKIPEALLVVVYFCVALKRSAYMWWVEGKAENLLRTMIVELPREKRWERYLRWPVEQVLGGGEVIGFDGERFIVDRLAMSNIMNTE
ncbi:hypothetical protein D0Z07_0759 [Hyphodiscus hymeniophilus]|uniref:Uncharacterized protein n=1 Tax=Hyphodiscus hymeniophilus TaxID=353542 RepID=A0A9P6VR82_9HELO|nr:hypothetical protein D0Z07_0759 [Hyphodiscus hymeniophilus]